MNDLAVTQELVDDLESLFYQIAGEAQHSVERESLFVDSAIRLMDGINLEFRLHQEGMERNKRNSERKPGKWEDDRQRLIDLIDRLDHRMVALINSLEANIYGQGPSSLGRLREVIDYPIGTEIVWTADPWEVSARRVAGFCRSWGISTKDNRLDLLALIRDHCGRPGELSKFYKRMIPHIERLGPPAE